MSPDSRSYAFDSRANGYARGEGLAVVLLKTLDAALKDNDMIRAIILGSGCNHDGKTKGLHLPNTDAQEQLIGDTYSNSGLDLADTAYCEAHGTGTPVGDPLEARALEATIGRARQQRLPLLLGSVKTNIGHLEGGAGLAGVIKAVLALEKGIIPPSVNLIEPTSPRNMGIRDMREDELHTLLEAVISDTADPKLSALPPQIITGISTGGMIERSGAVEISWMDDPRFSHLRNMDLRRTTTTGPKNTASQLKCQLKEAVDFPAAALAVREALVAQLAQLTGLEATDVDITKPIHAHGVDSIVAVDLRTWASREVEAEIPALDILGGGVVGGVGGEDCEDVGVGEGGG